MRLRYTDARLPGLVCSRACRKGRDSKTLGRSLDRGQLLRLGSSFYAFIGQPMIGPLVATSARKKCAIQHAAVTLPIIHKCAAEVRDLQRGIGRVVLLQIHLCQT